MRVREFLQNQDKKSLNSVQRWHQQIHKKGT
jgi:hypothetical protein